MYILAITRTGQEFAYKTKSAHAVSKASREHIRDDLNSIRYKLNDGEAWHIYEVDEYDQAYDFAQEQKFYYTARGLRERTAF